MKEKELEDAILVISSMLNVIRRFCHTLDARILSVEPETILKRLLQEADMKESCINFIPLWLQDPSLPEIVDVRSCFFANTEKEILQMADTRVRLLSSWAEREPAIRGEEQITGRYLKALQVCRKVIETDPKVE